MANNEFELLHNALKTGMDPQYIITDSDQDPQLRNVFGSSMIKPGNFAEGDPQETQPDEETFRLEEQRDDDVGERGALWKREMQFHSRPTSPVPTIEHINKKQRSDSGRASQMEMPSVRQPTEETTVALPRAMPVGPDSPPDASIPQPEEPDPQPEEPDPLPEEPKEEPNPRPDPQPEKTDSNNVGVTFLYGKGDNQKEFVITGESANKHGVPSYTVVGPLGCPHPRCNGVNPHTNGIARCCLHPGTTIQAADVHLKLSNTGGQDLHNFRNQMLKLTRFCPYNAK